MDTYFRGNSHELEFCKRIQAGGNHLVATTAAGRQLGEDGHLRLRERELAAVLTEYRSLPDAERKPVLEDPSQASPPRRPVPEPPRGGLVIRGFCTYLRQDEKGQFERAAEYYYRENPDRWAAETQSDMLWLTQAEWKSLVPADPRPGDRAEVASAIQRRFFSTIGIDYMEGSVNSLAPRQTTMTITVERVSADGIAMRLDGYGRMGKEFEEGGQSKPNSRGCEIRLLGRLNYDTKVGAFDRFDVVGVGEAWGNKMDYVRREIRVDRIPWQYGIACELVRGDSPIDRVPPYNLLHYGSAGPYFANQ